MHSGYLEASGRVGGTTGRVPRQVGSRGQSEQTVPSSLANYSVGQGQELPSGSWPLGQAWYPRIVDAIAFAVLPSQSLPPELGSYSGTPLILGGGCSQKEWVTQDIYCPYMNEAMFEACAIPYFM